MITAIVAERLSEVIISKAFENTYAKVKTFFKDRLISLVSDKNQMYTAIEQHITYVDQWSSEISLKEMASSKKLHQVFVKLKIYSGSKRNNSKNSKSQTFDYENVFQQTKRNIAIVGLPGAGKTTSMKFICQNIIESDKYLGKEFYFPILIRLRELLPSTLKIGVGYQGIETITERICKILGIEVKVDSRNKSDDEAEKLWALRQMLYNIVEEIKPIIILDGLDEISSHINRDIIAKEINDIGLNLKNSRIILTTRSGEFYYNLEAFDSYEIASLEEEQIEEFAQKWFNDKELKDSFLNQLRKSPYFDTAIRPLTLAHLCTIFEKNHSIPEQPKSIYRYIIELLLKEWDQQNFVVRKSKYSSFEIDQKQEFLSCLAYNLTLSTRSYLFSRQTLTSIYITISKKFKLPNNQVNEVIDELETHNGLFIKSGFDAYEFSHKSLQEFLTADYISRLPSPLSDIQTIYMLPHELAIATSISSDPTLYFYEAVINKIGPLHRNLNFGFLAIYFKRLVLEKPLFSSEVILSLGLIELFTKYINYTKQFKGEVLTSFKQIWEIDAVQDSFSEFSKYYAISLATSTKQLQLDGSGIQIFQAKRHNFINEEYLKRFKRDLLIPKF